MKKIFVYTISVAFIVGAVYWGRGCIANQEREITKLEEYVEYLTEETVPLRFKILARDSSRIKFAVKLFDAQGTEIEKKEMELTGTELSFDFYMVKVGERFVAFPYKIFTDAIAPQNGVTLLSMYNRNDFPQIFYHNNINEGLQNALTEIYTKLRSGNLDEIESQYGSGVHDVESLKSFLPDHVYKIVVHTKGGIEVMSD